MRRNAAAHDPQPANAGSELLRCAAHLKLFEGVHAKGAQRAGDGVQVAGGALRHCHIRAGPPAPLCRLPQHLQVQNLPVL